MAAPFLTANDVIAVATDRGGIASVNGYDPIKIRVEVCAVMSPSLTLRASNLSELKGMIADELNRQFETPQERSTCNGWGNKDTWRIAMAFGHIRALNDAKKTYLDVIRQANIEISAESLKTFACDSIFTLAPQASEDVIYKFVRWDELAAEWMNEVRRENV
jgi:hypothetical protein